MKYSETELSSHMRKKKGVLTHYGPGVDLASNRNEYQEYFLGG
jgi:hypothetical protein